MRRGRFWTSVAVAGLLLVAAACGSNNSSGSPQSRGGKIEVVVAESFWASIAAQLGGDRVNVTSIISSPDTDPHDYEPTPQDGRAIADAQYVIFNGLGYDSWASKALDANPSSDRTVLEVGKLLGLRDGDNPHRWYFPADVDKVIARISHDYEAIDPGDRAYFQQQHDTFAATGLQRYKGLLDQLHQRFAGTPIGASESIVVGLTDATGLQLVTPSSFLTAVREGNAPTAADKATVDQQITGKQIKAFVFNVQNSTPDVQSLVSEARTNGIEVVAITETPPENVAFQDWQSAQLQALLDALARATGK